MSSEEKLEQSTIVKERGTMYFKVSLQRGPGRSRGVGMLTPAAVTRWIRAAWSSRR